jgi:aryl-alcohol dehydrogenase-like predicted oxidoreductase
MKLGIGTAQFGLKYGIANTLGIPSLGEVEKIFDICIKNGIAVIDTAPAYGNSESIIGNCLKKRNNFKIITKTLTFQDLKSDKIYIDNIEKTFANSLLALKQEHVYALLVHHAADLLNPFGDILWRWLERVKAECLVKKIGVSVYDSQEIDSILERYPIEIIQLPINILDQRLLNSGHLIRLKKAGVEIHARSVFLQGLLLIQPDLLEEKFQRNKPLLEDLRLELRKSNLDIMTASLKFLLGIDEIDCIILGVDNSRQLIKNISAANSPARSFNFFKFSSKDLHLIDPRRWQDD